MTATPPRVVVMGGSLGGLTAALCLRDAGCAVEIYERARAPLTGLGAGIVLNPATTRYLTERAGLDITTISTITQELRYMDVGGAIVHAQPSPYRFSSYNTLYRSLIEQLDPACYHLGASVVGFTQDAAGVNVRLADGRQTRCDLLVCADGIRSSARQLLLPEASLQYAGYIAWRGTLALEQLDAPTRAMLDGAITYHVMPHSHLLTYPILVAGQAGAPQTYANWLWYRNVAAGPALNALLTDRDGVLREVSLPPAAPQPHALAALYADAAAQLPPPLASVVRGTAEPFIQAVFDCEVPRMAFGRLCLIGDAAFVARPHAAAGTAKAAADGWALGEAMRAAGGDVVAALQRWEAGQLQLGRAVLERTRTAGQRVQFEQSWQVGEPLPFGLYTVGDSLVQ